MALALGLLARVITVFLAPQSAYLLDHINNMGWSSYAAEHGPWRIYELPQYQPVIVRTQDPRSGRVFESVRPNALACNYPPLSAYIFWLQGTIWHTLDTNEVTLAPTPRMAQFLESGEPVTGRVIDTPASRFANAFPGIVFDFLLAWGVMHLLRVLRGPHRYPWLETIAFSVVVLAPPIILDSATLEPGGFVDQRPAGVDAGVAVARAVCPGRPGLWHGADDQAAGRFAWPGIRNMRSSRCATCPAEHGAALST